MRFRGKTVEILSPVHVRFETVDCTNTNVMNFTWTSDVLYISVRGICAPTHTLSSVDTLILGSYFGKLPIPDRNLPEFMILFFSHNRYVFNYFSVVTKK